MKRLLLILSCMLISPLLWGNAIDVLKTDDEVSVFLNRIAIGSPENKGVKLRVLSADSVKIKLAGCADVFQQWNLKNWEKADFNNDGLTDLIVMTYYYDIVTYVVMDNGDNSFRLTPIFRNISSQSCRLAKPFKMGDQQLLAVLRNVNVNGSIINQGDIVQKTDTLIYKYGGFIELNAKPSNSKIKMINYSTTHCYGTCPVFSLDIYADNYARYMAVDNNPTKGDFETQIAEEAFDELIGLISYLDIKKLDDNYAVKWTDDQTGILKVQFRDGTVKNIKDYGLSGSFGLSRLYEMLAQLRLNQEWN